MFASMSNTLLVIREIKAAVISRPLTAVRISVFLRICRGVSEWVYITAGL